MHFEEQFSVFCVSSNSVASIFSGVMLFDGVLGIGYFISYSLMDSTLSIK